MREGETVGRKAERSGGSDAVHRKTNEYNQSGQRGIVSCFGCRATQRHHSFIILLIAKEFTAYILHTA